LTQIREVLTVQQAIEAHLGIPQQLGRYHVRRKIGEGGMGVVYEGYDPFIARRVALKAIRQEYVVGPDADEFLHRLQREAQAAGSLNHPNVVAVYDYCEGLTLGADGTQLHTPFIVMEYIEGRELASRFKSQERFAVPEIQRIMGQILDALRYLHSQGVVHRDIKPGNIILLNDGSVKVADFGIARIESSTLTRVGSVMGSPDYMSPEQFGGQAVDNRCDLYAAAVILYQFLTGKLPLSGAPSASMHRALYELPPAPSAVSADVPKAFDKILRRALAKRASDRFQTAAEFKQAIMAVSAPDTGATRITPKAASDHGLWRSRLAPSAIIGALVVTIVLAVFIGNRISGHASAGGQPLAASITAAPQEGQIPSASMILPSFESTHYTDPSVGAVGATAARPLAGTLGPAALPEATHPYPADAPIATAPQESRHEPVVDQPMIAQTSELSRKPATRLVARKTDSTEYHCSDLLQKASLEPLSQKEATTLAKSCQ
jgi:serine/threonine protein kinase